jgi:K+/H+ antiporter YhaU regulatory subunit KhtT
MINLISNKDNSFKNQIEFLLGKEVSLTNEEINSLAHLTTGNLWIVKVLEKLNLSIDDIIYENDKKILRSEAKIEIDLVKLKTQ